MAINLKVAVNLDWLVSHNDMVESIVANTLLVQIVTIIAKTRINEIV